MTRLIRVYLVRLDSPAEDVYQTASREDALAFQDEFNSRSLERGLKTAAFADVYGVFTAKPKRRRAPGLKAGTA